MLSELERRAWDNRTSSEQHKPEMACKVVLDDMARGVLKAAHVAIVVVEDLECGHGQCVHIYQAGGLSELAVEGALGRAIAMQARKEHQA